MHPSPVLGRKTKAGRQKKNAQLSLSTLCVYEVMEAGGVRGRLWGGSVNIRVGERVELVTIWPQLSKESKHKEDLLHSSLILFINIFSTAPLLALYTLFLASLFPPFPPFSTLSVLTCSSHRQLTTNTRQPGTTNTPRKPRHPPHQHAGSTRQPTPDI